MSMDDFMRSLSDQQKAMFMAALQDSGTPTAKAEQPAEEDIDMNPEWTTTMPPHIRKEMEEQDAEQAKKTEPMDFAMNQVKTGKQPVRATGENGFVDDGVQCKSEEEITPEYTPTRRTRRPAEKVTVTCSTCGKSEAIQKQYVTGEYYRCSKCVGR